MNKIIKNTFILSMITLVAGLLLGLVYNITKDPIAEQQEIRRQESYKTVFMDAGSFEEDQSFDAEQALNILKESGFPSVGINEVLTAQDHAGAAIGYVFNITSKEGYGGDITFAMGIRLDGTVNGIEMLSISETAGLGMKAASDSFKEQYAEKNVESFIYTSDGAQQDHEIDSISGATITTKAVTDGVNAALLYFRQMGGN